MARLLTHERPTTEFELSSSTKDDLKKVRAYARPSMEDLAAMRGQDAVYILVSRLITEWSWEDENGVAPITPENCRLIDPVDFIEISETLGVDDFLNRISNASKKKNSSGISSPNVKPRREKVA